MCVNSLNDLLEKPFKRFTEQEQLEIVRKGRFTELVNLCNSDKSKRRTFWASWYEKVKWLTGNTINGKLYCWHCVLFPTGTAKTWNKAGFDDLRNLSQAIKKHEETREHIYSSVKLTLLRNKVEKRCNNALDFEKHIEVKRNREYLERLIDISSTLARAEVDFRKEANEEGPFRSFVHLFKKYDGIVRSQLEQTHDFHGLTTTFQIGLVHSMEEVILKKITEEVAAANFFSLMVDELNSDPETKNISLSIRYIKKGVPVERFIGLFDIRHGAKAEEVAVILDRELGKFNYKEKMITQSYDGKVVKATELYSLQQDVKRLQNSNCQAQLVHYYAHDFRLLLAQSLNSISECKLFFCAITLFCNFFQNLNIYEDKTLFVSIPSCINTLATQYESILRILEFTTTDEQYENTPIFIADAVNLITHLKNLKFMIFVTMFNKFFSLVRDFIVRAEKVCLNINLIRKEVNSLISNLRFYKDNNKFKNLIEKSLTVCTGSPIFLDDMFTLNVQIIDSLIHEIEGRFLDIELADFFILASMEYLTGSEQAKKLSSYLISIKENYPTVFDTNKLKSELELLYVDSSIGGFGYVEIKHTKDVLKFIYENDLTKYIPELHKLLELIVTVPSMAEPLDEKLCVLNRINSYRSSDKKEEPRSGLALLAIERDLLLEMEKNDQWYSQVIDCFSKLPITSSIELVYKTNRDGNFVRDFKPEVITQPELEIKSEPDMF